MTTELSTNSPSDGTDETARASISVIIPVFNNAYTIDELIERLVAVLDPLGHPFELLLIDDGSTDGSWFRINDHAIRDPRVVGIALSRNFGQHPAIRVGLERARGDLTVLMDADLQDQPEELPQLLTAIRDSAIDIVYTRWTMTDGSSGRMLSRVFHSVFSRLARHQVPPNIGTYRVFTRLVRNALLAYPERGAVYGPLMAQMGFSSTDVGVHRRPPPPSGSSYTLRRRLSLAASSLISYGSWIFQLTIGLGLVLGVTSAVYLVVLAVQYMIGGRVLPNGLSLVLGVTVMLSGMVLFTVGILSAYVMAMFREVLARPMSHVARVVGQGISGPDRSEPTA